MKKIYSSYCEVCKSRIIGSSPNKKFCDSCRKERFSGKNNPWYGKGASKEYCWYHKKKPIECYYADNGCLICTSHPSKNKKNGSGLIWRDRKNWKISRWVFYINNRFLPDVVMHTCDNVDCINPLHLIAGTTKKNALDMVNKGRAPDGNKGRPKLDDSKVFDILLKLNQGRSLMSLAQEYNVSKKTILNIKQNKKWRHINRKNG